MIDTFTGDYAFLSNFFELPNVMTYMGHECATSEHAFHLAKAETVKSRAFVAAALTPGQAKRRGRRVRLREDWEDVKISIMREVVFLKFFGNPELAGELVRTHTEELVEGNTWNDTFWGVNSNTNEGQNHLGKILMEARRVFSRAQRAHKISVGRRR